MDSKKIVFLSRYQNRVERGVESAVYELSKRLGKSFDVTILSGQDADSLGKILKGKYNIIIPTNGRLQAFKASLGRIFGRYKIVIIGHAGVGRDDLWNLTICLPNVFIALTEYQKRWAEKYNITSKIMKIPNGIDLEKFREYGSKVDLRLEKPIILSVGSLHWYKHHERTIRAVSHLMKGSLLIIGTGPQEEKLRNYGNKLLGAKRFKITSVPYREMPKYYRCADVFTLSSWDRESFGIVYLEAMASNLPVVAPDDSVRREIISNAGVFTNVEDSQRFALSLEYAINTNWESKPREQAKKYSWENITIKYVDLLKQL